METGHPNNGARCRTRWARQSGAEIARLQSLQIASIARRYGLGVGPRIDAAAADKVTGWIASGNHRIPCQPRSTMGAIGTIGIGAGDWASGSFSSFMQQGACFCWASSQPSQQSDFSAELGMRSEKQMRTDPPTAGDEIPSRTRRSNAMAGRTTLFPPPPGLVRQGWIPAAGIAVTHAGQGRGPLKHSVPPSPHHKAPETARVLGLFESVGRPCTAGSGSPVSRFRVRERCRDTPSGNRCRTRRMASAGSRRSENANSPDRR